MQWTDIYIFYNATLPSAKAFILTWLLDREHERKWILIYRLWWPHNVLLYDIMKQETSAAYISILIYLLYLKLILSNQIAPLVGHKSLYGPLNSLAGHIGIYGLLMANTTNFGWKKIFVQNCQKKLLLELDLIANKKNYGWKKWWPHNGPQATWPWPQSAINPCIICKYIIGLNILNCDHWQCVGF